MMEIIYYCSYDCVTLRHNCYHEVNKTSKQKEKNGIFKRAHTEHKIQEKYTVS